MATLLGIREVRATEAKAKLAELLSDVERGETVVITRHGKRIARLVPEDEPRTPERQAEIESAVASIKSRMGPKPVDVEQILADVREGRR
jgi:prevent-host-death family protein